MNKADAIVVLGLKLRPDGTPEQALLDRVALAARLLKEERAGLVIPCGGQTTGTPVSEARVMADVLFELGVEKGQVLPEDQSLYTVENIRNALRLLRQNGVKRPRVILVTSDYHSFRAAYMARKMGMRVKSISSRTPWNKLKRQRLRLEFFYFFNYAMGWETGKRPRPAWYDRAVKRIQG